MTASGSVSDFDETRKTFLRTSIAAAAGVDASAVTVAITAGSVLIPATIAVPASTMPAAVWTKLSASVGSAAAASTALGVTVVSIPIIVVAEPRGARPAPSSPGASSDGVASDGKNDVADVLIAVVLGGSTVLLATIVTSIHLYKKQNRRAALRRRSEANKVTESGAIVVHGDLMGQEDLSSGANPAPGVLEGCQEARIQGPRAEEHL